jgi:hypothetical protein
VSVTLRPVLQVEALLVLALLYLPMAGAMLVCCVAALAVTSVLALAQHVLLAEMEMLVVVVTRRTQVETCNARKSTMTAAWAAHLEVQSAVAVLDLFQVLQARIYLIVKDLTAKMLRKRT